MCQELINFAISFLIANLDVDMVEELNRHYEKNWTIVVWEEYLKTLISPIKEERR